ncbi:glycoside hydrolase family 105 protein [Sunxiuqinia elliptica]|uniref:Rhamnogalacturonyl hydrolase YesR n=1 Tax=Sunxiuqinia elliptica TaxID=655355 RepID=A0A4R6GSQ5_9BACT|nr:glycoside hydrolase family 88 protein [Sunxiuqinia elliptica]TDN98411.1 rhamnogalacturonyl hydrolase YesR [Sunxiuqinia elliptica]TDO60514.1 rhamnogalacturonyl hydrolase YesR [Sunxiuqinia elliptica]
MPKFIIVTVAILLFNVSCSKTSQNSKGNTFETENLQLNKNQVKSTLDVVAAWQMENLSYNTSKNLHDNGVAAWTNATFYLGLLKWAKVADNDSAYLTWLKHIGEETNWTMAENFKDYPRYQLYHADEFCIAQMYLGAYDLFGEKKMMLPSVERLNWVLNNPPNSEMQHRNKQSWTWCDALFMVPQVYAQVSVIKNDEKYLRFMDQEFKRTFNYLYSKDDKLFFRDDSYFDKKEENGEKVFWGRGNGWVAAGLVNLLKILPEDSEYRPFYENLFVEFVPRLVDLQNSTGFWHASLLDPQSYPAPETSATALITYALAYGINNNLVDKATYSPALYKAWTALLSAVDTNGKIGWVQPIGADPKKVTADMTASYGVGAFLLAGSEIYQLN